MRGRIADQTREIALAALGRPYVFFVSRNLEDWRSGKDHLRFVFRFTNHGTGPAIVKEILACALLSYGSGKGDRGETSITTRFPDPEELMYFLRRGLRIKAKSSERDGWLDWKQGQALILPPSASSILILDDLPL